MQAVNWWLSQVRFTSINERSSTNAENTLLLNSTSYLELALHVDIATGVNLGGADADLATKSNQVLAALRHLAKRNNLMVNGVPCSFAEAFKPRSSPHTKLLTGLWLPSISRGVCYSNYPDIYNVALVNVMRARSLLDCRLPDVVKLRAALLGKNYRAITPTNLPKPTWQPTQMEFLHRVIQHTHDSCRRPPLSLKCIRACCTIKLETKCLPQLARRAARCRAMPTML